jgi:bacterioferritin-associated ferredoxin
MIVCSCTMITAKDIAEAVSAIRTGDPFVVLTPGTIYRQLGKRPSCGGCLPPPTRRGRVQCRKRLPSHTRRNPSGGRKNRP